MFLLNFSVRKDRVISTEKYSSYIFLDILRNLLIGWIGQGAWARLACDISQGVAVVSRRAGWNVPVTFAEPRTALSSQITVSAVLARFSRVSFGNEKKNKIE